MGWQGWLSVTLAFALAGCASPQETSKAPDETIDATAPPVGGIVDEALAKTGRWLPPQDGGVSAIHAALLHDGRLVYWAGLHTHGPQDLVGDGPQRARSRVLDLSNHEPLIVVPTPETGGGNDMFCAGQTVLADGTVLVAGGGVWSGARGMWYGSRDGRVFDPSQDNWTMVGKMEKARWYPSALVLPDGRALVASGMEVVMQSGTMVRALEVYDPTTKDFATLPSTADRTLPMYPRLFEVPNGPLKGQIYFQPAGCLWCPGGEEADEAQWEFDAALDLDTNTWTQFQSTTIFGARQNPITVMLPLRPPEYKAEIFTAAGTLQRSGAANPTAEITDLGGASPAHRLAAPLVDGRWFGQHVLLPDGEILIAGGSKIDGMLTLGTDSNVPMAPVLSSELYDPSGRTMVAGQPVSGATRLVGNIAHPRVYHSTALLLPDGRVWLSGSSPVDGSVFPEHTDNTFELYEPPYLFRGPRPTITEAPQRVDYGAGFDVATPDAGRIEKAVLMRPGAVTHVYNPDQRMIELVIESATSGGVRLRAPADAELAPTGYWMLFLVASGEGGPVPSEAAFFHLGPD